MWNHKIPQCLLIIFGLLWYSPFLRGSEPWYLKDSGVFYSFPRSHVAISESGEIFLYDWNEKLLLHFDRDGKRLKDVAAHGDGPGMVGNVRFLIYEAKTLYVRDAHFMSSFSHEGVFIDKKKIPDGLGVLKKIPSGWLGYSGPLRTEDKEPFRLFLLDSDFKETKEIGTWPGDMSKKGVLKQGHFEGRTYVKHYNPVSDKTMLATDLDGRFAYFRPSGLKEVSIFDLSNGKLAGKISLGKTRIPFNRDWGMAKLKEASKPDPDRVSPFETKFEENFPDYFPRIRSMFFTKANHLMILKWKETPSDPETGRSFHQKEDWLCYDPMGQPVSCNVLDFAESRIVAEQNGMAWFIYMTPDEEFTVARCPTEELEATLNAHRLSR